MPITIFTGLPGSGKSARTAKAILFLLQRNAKWHKKTGVVRKVMSNLKLNEKYEKKYKDYLAYWKDPEQLPLFADCDVVIDEIATYFDATQWKELSLDIKRWLQQHRKVGVEIYGNTQTFSTIDISFRRLTDELFLLKKLLGSRDPSPTKPPVKAIWGVVLIRKLDARNYKEEEQENKAYGFSLMWISKQYTSDFYDTRQKIERGEYPPLRHSERRCLECGKVHITHQ